MNIYAILTVVYQGFAKVATNSGVNPVDLCFIRTFINLCISIFNVILHQKHVLNDLPKAERPWVYLRAFFGFIGFTLLLFSVMYIPIFIVNIIINIAPFITAILAYFINNEAITKLTMVCILGSFIGVLIIAFAK